LARCTIWSPAGVLATGIPRDSVDYALKCKPDVIAIDAGSTDAGPYYLGTASTYRPKSAVKKDMKILLEARNTLGVPLIIGSCGTCGSDAMVDFYKDVCLEIAKECALAFKLAVIYSEQSRETVLEYFRANRVQPLRPILPLDEPTIASCEHIVGVIGIEPIVEAIRQGAEVILTGRATDTALFAAVPVMRGLSKAGAWHGAKTVECGALCTDFSGGGGAIFTVDETGFEVEPSSPRGKCTPYTVSAHMLYENSNPFQLTEPGGVLKVDRARYVAMSDRRVRVEGSEFIEAGQLTMKLEGAVCKGHRSMMMVGIRSPKYILNIDLWQENFLHFAHRRVERDLGLTREQFHLEVRRFGLDAVPLSAVPPRVSQPDEIAVMLLITAPSHETSLEIAQILTTAFFHFPLDRNDEVPSFAFPFTPSQVDIGPVYEFALNHVMLIDSFDEVTRTEYMEVGGPTS